MGRRKVLPGGQGDSWTVPFYIPTSGGESATFGAAAETVFFSHPNNAPNAEANTSTFSHVVVPFPIEIERVTFKGQAAAASDQIRLRVRRHPFTADETTIAAGVDLIETANTAAPATVVDYIRTIATTAGGYEVLDYVGEPLETGTRSTAEGFSETAVSGASQGFSKRSRLNTGDEITVTGQCPTSGDNFSHVKVWVTFARLD